MEKQKIIMIEVGFLTENFFYKTINPFIFQKKYFSEFLLCESIKGNCLFQENKVCDFLYFIKEGEIELKIEANLIELNQLIKTLVIKSNITTDYVFTDETSNLKINFLKNKILN